MVPHSRPSAPTSIWAPLPRGVEPLSAMMVHSTVSQFFSISWSSMVKMPFIVTPLSNPVKSCYSRSVRYVPFHRLPAATAAGSRAAKASALRQSSADSTLLR